MKSRDANDDDALYGDSPGYQFCTTIAAINDEITQYAKMHDSIVETQHHLINAYNNLRPKMYDEENNRPHLKISATLIHHLEKHETIEHAHREKLKALERDYNHKKDQFSAQNTDLTNSILIELAKNAANQVKQQKEYEDQFNPLNTESIKLEREYKLKEEEIDTKCCSSCFCCIAKETRQLADMKAKKDDIYSKIDRLQKNPPQKESNENIANLELQRKSVIEQLEKLNTIDFPTSRDAEQKLLDDSIVKYKEDKIEYDRKIKSHYSLISKDTLLGYLQTYSCYTEVTTKMEEAWARQFKHSHENQSTNDDTPLLKQKLHKYAAELDNLVKSMRCPAYSNLTVMDTYKTYLTLSEKDKHDFRTDKYKSDVIKTLLPPQAASLLSNGNNRLLTFPVHRETQTTHIIPAATPAPAIRN